MLKVVLTGGPCSGKTNALSKLTEVFEEKGYKVITVPEAATTLFYNGIRPTDDISSEKFQDFIFDMQLNNEDLFNRIAESYNSDKTIVFYDRGLLDGRAYMDEKTDFDNVIKKHNFSVSDIYSRYDAVLHLITAADGAEEFYQWNNPLLEDVGNNAARSESPEEARIKDKKTLNAWIGHPHLRIFDNNTNFNVKLSRVVAEVSSLLGEPAPKEIERKFLIIKPTEKQLQSLGCISKTKIIQTYLKPNNNNIERRIRQRGNEKDGFNFYYTEKNDVSNGIRIENERKITPDEFLHFLTEADTSLHQIFKTRYCFIYESQYFEMDVYPFDDKYAIIEIELNNIYEKINFPPLTFIKEVTNDKTFRNSSLAKTRHFRISDRELFFENIIHEPDWIYETGKDDPDVIYSDSKFLRKEKTKDFNKAIQKLKSGEKNYLIRKKKINGKTLVEEYNTTNETWISKTP